MPNLNLNLAESPSPEVVMEKYSAERFPEFQELFASSESEAKLPLQSLLRKPNEDQVSVVLHNRSAQDVTVVALRWIFPEATGKASVSKQALTSYGVNVFRPIIAAGEKLLASPLSGTVQESLMAHVKAGGGTIRTSIRSSRDPELPPEGEMGFALDLVAFADGEIAGADPDRFAVKVQSRKRAADYVARQIRQAENDNRDPRPVLQALIELPHGRDDHFLAAVRSFAISYMMPRHFPSPEQRLRNMENLLSPPRFFRRQDSRPPIGPAPS